MSSSVKVDFGIGETLSLFFLKALLIYTHCLYFLFRVKKYFQMGSLMCSCGRRTDGYFEVTNCHKMIVLLFHGIFIFWFLFSDSGKVSDKIPFQCLCALTFISSLLQAFVKAVLEKTEKTVENTNLRASVYLIIYIISYLYIIDIWLLCT